MSHDHPTDPILAPEDAPEEAGEATVGRRRFVRMGLLGLGGAAAALLAPLTASAHPHGRRDRYDDYDDYDDYDEWDDYRRRGRRRGRRRHRSHRVRGHRNVGYHCKPCGLRCRSYDHLSWHVHKVHHIPFWRLMHVLVFGRGGWYFYG